MANDGASLHEGFYDLLLTEARQAALEHLDAQRWEAVYGEAPEGEELLHALASHLSAEILDYLRERCGELPPERMLPALRVELRKDDFRALLHEQLLPAVVQGSEAGRAGAPSQGAAEGKAQPRAARLLGLWRHGNRPAGVARAAQLAEMMPQTPLGVSALLTGSELSPSLLHELMQELRTCDRADWLVSFIRLSGVMTLMPALKVLTATPAPGGGPRLRVATTTYIGATEAKAIAELCSLPHTEVRVCYDTSGTRLHAKSYIFHRATGFGSAYVGSSNVSRYALDQGLEWNVKLSQHELPHLWEAVTASFESHWEDEEHFRRFDASQLPQLQAALERERHSGSSASVGASAEAGAEGSGEPVFYDLQPRAHQEVALQAIARERRAGIRRHLIVAATGTGKTLIAAFDFARFAREHAGVRLLFLAHRVEILHQAQASFRQVLRDADFGVLVDGSYVPRPGDERRSWFCTVESWRSRAELFSPRAFGYVVIDEAHHSAATGYVEALERLRPLCLLGLTATPERMDGQDILPLFGGRITHELRLADAIAAGLLSPFLYFGLNDEPGMDFSRLAWRVGGYDRAELGALLEHNEQRAGWVLHQLLRHVEEPRRMRALGFCVSVRHAAFMAEFCNRRGLPALALTGESERELRREAGRKLESCEVNVIFTVDLFNEGVDLPFVDTVIFLRPTESLTVFLQQLGRGLRLDRDKEHLRVFDFIAAQHHAFNFAARFAALCRRPCGLRRMEEQVREGFPDLPPGCMVSLEETAMEKVLENVWVQVARLRSAKGIRAAFRQARRAEGKILPLDEMMELLGCESPDAIYARGLPSRLQCLPEEEPALEAAEDVTNTRSDALAKALRRLLLQSDGELLREMQRCLASPSLPLGSDGASAPSLFYSVLWSRGKEPSRDLATLHALSVGSPGLRRDLDELVDWRLRHGAIPAGEELEGMGPLRLHASYTREQIMLALGESSFEQRTEFREGVRFLKERGIYLFLADVEKDERLFSPSTMYEDYAISASLFHWQSQSTTSAESPTGQNFIHHAERGIRPMLFLRRRKRSEEGVSMPYVFLGPLHYVSHRGSRPMSIRWRLERPMPAEVLRWAQRALI